MSTGKIFIGNQTVNFYSNSQKYSLPKSKSNNLNQHNLGKDFYIIVEKCYHHSAQLHDYFKLNNL